MSNEKLNLCADVAFVGYAAAKKKIEQLEARNAELEKEVAHWKNNHETEVRRARILKERTDMPIDRVQAYEKWGDDQRRIVELTAEVERLRFALADTEAVELGTAEVNAKLRQQLASAEEHNARMRVAWNAIEINSEECLDFDECTAMLVPLDDYNAMSDALSLPASSEALDKYVAEKVKEETDEYAALSDRLAKLLAETAVALKGEEAALTRHSWHDLPVIALAKMVEISELTKQRDLAVSAIENLVKQKGRHNTEIAYKKLVDVLAAIKESGATK